LNNYISDTMALVLTLERRRLPYPVKQIFDKAKQGKAEILIPSIVLAELAYLSEKNRIETDLIEAKYFLEEFPAIMEFPMSMDIIIHSFEIDDIPELHDRLIAGSAKKGDSTILTDAPVIRSSSHGSCLWG